MRAHAQAWPFLLTPTQSVRMPMWCTCYALVHAHVCVQAVFSGNGLMAILAGLVANTLVNTLQVGVGARACTGCSTGDVSVLQGLR